MPNFARVRLNLADERSLGWCRVQRRTSLTVRRGLIVAMGLSLVAYFGGLVLQGGASHRLVDVWLSMLASWLPVAVCWLAVWRVGLRRLDVLFAAAGVTLLAAGDTYYAPIISDWSPPFPGPGDVGYLLFYLLMLASLVVVVRDGARGRASSVWLDCAVGSLGAATTLAVLLSPVLESALTGLPPMATAVSVAYPMSDLLLVAAVAGMVALRGVRRVRGGDRWVLLMVGLIVYAAADVVYALQVTTDAYAVGTPLDGVWGIGVALIALNVDGAARGDRSAARETKPATGASALVVSSVATAAALGVLLVGTRAHLSMLAVVLAGGTLLAAASRTQVAFRQLVRMADLRRQATMDHLTDLPNRRALYVQAGARLADPEHGRQALLLLDLDRFKEVNDSLGHHAGDQLLIQVGARLRENTREGDLLVRLPGRAGKSMRPGRAGKSISATR